MSDVRVLIATPCQDHVCAGFALDLAKLVGYSTLASPPGSLELILMQIKGTIIPQQRNTLAQQALDTAATHILWLDADMRFPKDALVRLLAHDVPIVAANYPTRRPPILPTAEHHEHGRLFTTPESTGLAEVSHAGMGVMLVTTTVFRTLPKPWFTLGYNKRDDGFVGEDVYFCRQAKAHGFATLIDQDFSKEVRHLGELPFSMEHALATRDAYLASQQPAIERAR